jgi:hypothetical protein
METNVRSRYRFWSSSHQVLYLHDVFVWLKIKAQVIHERSTYCSFSSLPAAPESQPLLTVLTPGILQPGDFLEATCLVSNSRPAANITWHVGDEEVTSGITEDNVMDSTWRWNHDPQTVQSRLRLQVDSSHDGKKLSCRANHLALPSGFQNSTLVDIRVIS